ncbi:ROK family protein [Galactobacter valiniphilus]|uniref:ROK family protein n=1 Tax=Galactobacter valiniphilus TaxID=2676122 RepID=UPI003736875B
MNAPLALGLDLGGTKTAGALITGDGTALARARAATPAARGARAVLGTIADVVRELLAQAPGPVLGLGLGAAGTIDPASASVVAATDTLPGWAGTRLRPGLTEALHDVAPAAWVGGSPRIEAVNDVHAHGLGEAWLGAAAGAPTALLVAFGTGVGGSFLVDGAPLTGGHHVGGHVGHVPSVQAAGLPCSCGATGHLEAIAAGPALAARYARLGGAAVDTPEVIARAGAGEALASRVVQAAATAAGEGLAGLANALDPHRLVVSGGLAEAGATWWEPVLRAYRSAALPAVRAAVPVKASLGGDAATLGAASLLLRGTPPA